MLALSLGLFAALCWGIHDLCVRYVSQEGSVLVPLSVVLCLGTLILLPITVMLGHWGAMTQQAYGLSAISGAIFVVACIGLYRAFGIGPVPLVAPIIGAYPILSFLWAAYSGQDVLLGQWIALGCVVAGVAVVSILSDENASNGSRQSAVLWSVVAMFGFALTFATGQAAIVAGDELSVMLITRIVASIGVIILLFLSRGPKLAPRKAWALLAAMAVLDTLAMSVVLAAGTLERPEFTVVAASIFGVITIILARIFLKEHIKMGQWIGVILTFSGIAYLAF